MPLFPTVLQTQPAYAVDSIQESNSTYYFIPTGDVSGGGGGPTSSLVSPVTVTTADASGGMNNGISVSSDNTNNYPYGYFVQDINAGTENLVALVAEGNTATLQLGNAGLSNAYFTSSQSQSSIGNTDSFGSTLDLISWNPVGPTVTLKLLDPTVITGPSGDGIIYDTVYNPIPAPTNPPVPVITSPSAPTIITSWTNALAVASNTPYTVPATGLYLVTTTVTISVGVGYSFPTGSILNLTPKVQGTDDPYISHTYFLSTTGPQGNITTTQQGLGFYTAGAIIIGQLNQASTGTINLGPVGGCSLLIQQVINQYP
jgi:hypothetical protein